MWDFPVEGRLFISSLVLIFLAPFFAALIASGVEPNAANQEMGWYSLLETGAAVLLILSYVYGRSPEERARGRRTTAD